MVTKISLVEIGMAGLGEVMGGGRKEKGKNWSSTEKESIAALELAAWSGHYLHIMKITHFGHNQWLQQHL